MSETTHANFTRAASCQYCGGRLNLGYHFMCHVCGTAYCYIHMAKHERAHAKSVFPKSVADQVYAK